MYLQQKYYIERLVQGYPNLTDNIVPPGHIHFKKFAIGSFMCVVALPSSRCGSQFCHKADPS